MSGVPRDVAQHSLGVPVNATPRQQARRSFTGDKRKAIEEEVARLLSAGLIRPVKYPKWLANVVLVKKSSGAWRMCVDYTTINKVCPGDPYPLPRIDQLIDHETLSFLDMFSGYHQIPMSREDEEKTAFMTPFGNFCFVGMPFGLKNAGATYQRMIDTVFSQQRGRNIEAYVDDLIVNTKAGKSHLDDLRETFEALRKHSLRLNPLKCVFGVEAGKFLGFMITKRGIEVDPKQITAVQGLRAPRNTLEIQSLNGKIAALGRFIPRSADKCAPFFKTLKNGARFAWTKECEAALL
ncbi:unnamed protein product [Linum trigynum]|uniref:Reverse transcriptase domain-containing protein n=1 Tax=Linum trigynum TaxID=586398 RepID=A0AAV2DM91_9ROSI